VRKRKDVADLCDPAPQERGFIRAQGLVVLSAEVI